MKHQIGADYANNSSLYFSSLDKAYIKKHGIAYTPQWLAAHITNNAAEQWQKFNRGKKAIDAADICCGTGVFIGELASKFRENNWGTTISGFDIDKGAIEIAKETFDNLTPQPKLLTSNVLLQTTDNQEEPNME